MQWDTVYYGSAIQGGLEWTHSWICMRSDWDAFWVYQGQVIDSVILEVEWVHDWAHGHVAMNCFYAHIVCSHGWQNQNQDEPIELITRSVHDQWYVRSHCLVACMAFWDDQEPNLVWLPGFTRLLLVTTYHVHGQNTRCARYLAWILTWCHLHIHT